MIGIHVDLMVHHRQQALRTAAARNARHETHEHATGNAASTHGVVSSQPARVSHAFLASSTTMSPLAPNRVATTTPHVQLAHTMSTTQGVHNSRQNFGKPHAPSPAKMKIAGHGLDAMDTVASARSVQSDDAARHRLDAVFNSPREMPLQGLPNASPFHTGMEGRDRTRTNSQLGVDSPHHSYGSGGHANAFHSGPFLASSPTSLDGQMMQDIDDVPDVFTPSTELPPTRHHLLDDTLSSPYFLSEFDDDIAVHRGVSAECSNSQLGSGDNNVSSHFVEPSQHNTAAIDTSRPTHLRAFLRKDTMSHARATNNATNSHHHSHANAHANAHGQAESHRHQCLESDPTQERSRSNSLSVTSDTTTATATASADSPESVPGHDAVPPSGFGPVAQSEFGNQEFPRDIWDACRRGSTVFVEFFLRDDPSLNDNTSSSALDSDDHSPLYYACAGGHARLAIMLLEHNPMQLIDPSTECYQRSSPAIRRILDAHLKWQVARDDEILLAWQQSSSSDEELTSAADTESETETEHEEPETEQNQQRARENNASATENSTSAPSQANNAGGAKDQDSTT